MRHENPHQTPPAENVHPQPEAQPHLGHTVRPSRLSIAGIRHAWRRFRNADQQPVSEIPVQPEDVYELGTQGEEVAAVPAAKTDAETEVAEKPPVVSLFEGLVDTQALITERKHLAIDYKNRASDWIRQQLEAARAKLSEAEETRNMDRAAIERRRVYELETFSDEQYAIGERLNYMERNRAALMLSPDDERVAPLVEGLVASEQPQQQQFIDLQRLDAGVPDPGQRIFIERGRNDDPISLPVHNFVSAYGIRSWSRGREQNILKTNDQGEVLTSDEVIADYAQRTTQAPPIERVHAYIQPNGITLYVTESGVHRTAAAILRGDRMIQTNSLIVHQLGANLVNPESSNGPDQTVTGEYELPSPSMM